MQHTHQQHHAAGVSALGYRQPVTRSEHTGNTTLQATGSQLGSQTSSVSQALRPGFALQCYFEHKKTTYLQTSLSAFSFFQENVGNYITLPISIVHLCLFLCSLCTGNVFWLQFKSTSVPPKRSSLL